MARKTNYAFERNSRAKAKAEKREAKRKAKLAAKGERPPDEPTPGSEDGAVAPDAPADVTGQRGSD
jgi:hypothetical protein